MEKTFFEFLPIGVLVVMACTILNGVIYLFVRSALRDAQERHDKMMSDLAGEQ